MIADSKTRKTVESSGACNAADWSIFVTERPAEQAKAKATCSSCPIRELCLVEYWAEQGVTVGGLTSQERNARTLTLDVPPLVRARLVACASRGGVRGLMISCGLNEEDAITVAKALTEGL